MAGYVRQSAAEIVSGAVARASDLAAEFDEIQTAFGSSSGHNHSGSSGEGAPITVVGPAQDLIVTGTLTRPKTDNTMDLGSASFEFKDGYFDGKLYTDELNLNGTDVTSTAAELNILDGVTSTAAELNILDGVTSDATDLNALDGIGSKSGKGSNFFKINSSATAAEFVTPAQTHTDLLISRNAPTVGGAANPQNERTITTGLGLTLAAGLRIRALIPAANTGAMTLNLDGTGAVTVKTVTGADTPNGYIRTDVPTEFYYNGTNWIANRELESGESGNVQWRRWADGTLEIWNPSAPGNTGAESTWIFPAGVVFISNASMVAVGSCRTSAGVPRVVGFSGNATTSQDYSIYSVGSTPARVGDAAEIHIIGRWY